MLPPYFLQEFLIARQNYFLHFFFCKARTPQIFTYTHAHMFICAYVVVPVCQITCICGSQKRIHTHTFSIRNNHICTHVYLLHMSLSFSTTKGFSLNQIQKYCCESGYNMCPKNKDILGQHVDNIFASQLNICRYFSKGRKCSAPPAQNELVTV